MLFLLLSFLAGILSVFAACVLPLLPVIVGGSLSAGGERRRVYVIVGALALSVVVFTLLLKASTALIGIPEEIWRYLSGGIIVVLGILMIFPTLWAKVPFVNKLNTGSNKLLTAGYQRGGIWGDAIMGAALGPVFASCSPTYFIILATVLPATPLLGTVYLIAYAAGLSLALLAVAILGEKLVNRLGITLDPAGKFFKGIGVVLLVVGILVFTGYMRQVETWFVERGFDATFIELKLLGSEEQKMPIENRQQGFLPPEAKPAMYKLAPELVTPDGYVNTKGQRITLAQLRAENKVVLLDIWTYSCINCQRTIPYLRDWYQKYAPLGLEIVGVHTPEFAFEKLEKNVTDATVKFGVTWPVVLDNNYQTWNAYGNQYWPRKYLIDIDGFIIYDHIGEGAYVETEMVIQRALAERAQRLGLQIPEILAGAIPEGAVEVPRGMVKSPEIYFGAWRNDSLGNGVSGAEGLQTFSLPAKLSRNVLYFEGAWDIQYEFARSAEKSVSIRFLYESKDVYFVARADTPVRIKVTRDGGKPLGADRGSDVSADGYVTVKEDRLYKLVEGESYGQHELEMMVESPGLEAYTFTFG